MHYQYDIETGYFVCDDLGSYPDKLPDGVIDVAPPQPCCRPRWTGTEWVEDAPRPTEAPPDGCEWQWSSEGKEWVAAAVQGEVELFTRAQLDEAIDAALTRQRTEMVTEVQTLVATQLKASDGKVVAG